MTHRKPPRGLRGWWHHTRDTAAVVRSEMASVGVLGEIRAHLRALGIDEDQLTDDELERTIVDFGRVVAGAGIPWELAAEGLKLGCDILRSTCTWEQLDAAADKARADRWASR